MSIPEWWIKLAGGTIIVASLLRGAYFAFLGQEARIKRALRRARRTSIGEAHDGEVVTIVGTVHYGERTRRSPLTGKGCAVYSVLVTTTGRGGGKEVLCENGGVDFFVEDDSGVALVRIGDVAPSVAIKRTHDFDEPHPVMDRFMAAPERKSRRPIFAVGLRAYEGLVEERQRVAVCGLARWIADADASGGSYRESPKRLVLEAADAAPLLISDDPSVVR